MISHSPVSPCTVSQIASFRPKKSINPLLQIVSYSYWHCATSSPSAGCSTGQSRIGCFNYTPVVPQINYRILQAGQRIESVARLSYRLGFWLHSYWLLAPRYHQRLRVRIVVSPSMCYVLYGLVVTVVLVVCSLPLLLLPYHASLPSRALPIFASIAIKNSSVPSANNVPAILTSYCIVHVAQMMIHTDNRIRIQPFFHNAKPQQASTNTSCTKFSPVSNNILYLRSYGDSYYTRVRRRFSLAARLWTGIGYSRYRA